MQSDNKTYSYEEAYQASLNYFNGSEISARTFLDKYALRNDQGEILEKTPDALHRRLAKEFARIEKKKFKNPLTEDEIYNNLKNFSCIIAQGSPMYGIGNPYQIVSLSNCFVIPSVKDSYGGICRYDEQLAQVSKRRGGVGGDVAGLRPAGARTKNAARSSTGKVQFMSRFSNTIREVGQNGRRGAEMITTSIHHPETVIVWDKDTMGEPHETFVDTEDDYGNPVQFKTTSDKFDPNNVDFVTCKYDRTKVTGANISIRLTDEFLTALEKGEKFQQRWPVEKDEFEKRKSEGKYVYEKWVDASAAWDKIITGAWQMAEPGLLFWDTILRESPADCYADYGFRTVSTNPCGEIPLSGYDSCRLMVLNLFHFVENPWTPNATFNYKKLYEKSKLLQRLMDDLVDLEEEAINRIISKINSDPEDEDIKKNELDLWKNILNACKNGRRTGCGITALGDALAATGVGYATDKGIEEVDKIYKVLKFGCYQSSIDMAKEIGAFPVWNFDLEKDNPYLNRFKNESIDLGDVVIEGQSVYDEMKQYGRRNISLLTTAPTGSISMLAKLVNNFYTSSGIEPEFDDEPIIRKKKGNPGDENFRSDSIDQNGDHWMHFEIFCPAMKDWMEVSGETDWTKNPFRGFTANSLDWKKRVVLQATAQKHIDHSISSTVNLPKDVTVDRVKEIYETAWREGCKGITVYRDGSRTGVLVRKGEVEKTEKIQKTNAPKRPKDVPHEVHHCTRKGHRYVVSIGFLHGDPLEVFINSNHDNDGEIIIPKSVREGIVTKEARGKYVLRHFNAKGELNEYSLNNGQCDTEMEIIARFTSSNLRHGADIAFIVHTLEKIPGDMQAPSKVIARVLKKYIEDGFNVTGEECPECKSPSLVRQDGCVVCKACSWTKCT